MRAEKPDGLMSSMAARDVLIVDDDESIRSLLRIAVTRQGLTCDTATDGVEALKRIDSVRYSVVLTDLMMPRLDGAGLVKELAEVDRLSSDRPVILIMTAFPPCDPISVGGEVVHAVIRKPFDIGELAGLVQRCVEIRARTEPVSVAYDVGEGSATVRKPSPS
jgi:DNA-binding NtrC family response regulator